MQIPSPLPNFIIAMIFDLDPPSHREFGIVKKAAFDLKEKLQSQGLVPFVMTTGSRGLHVIAPLKRGPSFEDVRIFAKEIAEDLANLQTHNYTIEMRKENRANRVFIDYLRNAYGQTSVAPYAVRALAGSPIATPLDWRELRSLKSAKRYRISNIFRRLGQKRDPWRNLDQHARAL